jgi:uracil-DNA glycosylase family 4
MNASTRAGRLQELYSRIRKDPDYRSSGMADIFVPGRGTLEGRRIVLVGEAPGRNEEKTGLPFIGAAGKNLDMLLGIAGLLRADVFITNVIKYRPITSDGKNRNPSLSESRKALPFLLEELEILSPRLVVCLGLCPARTLLEKNLAMRDMNGNVFRKNGLDLLVAYHPSPFNFMIAEKREEMSRVFSMIRGIVADWSLCR